MRALIFLALVSPLLCQEQPHVSYDFKSVEGAGDKACPLTEGLRDSIHQDVYSLLTSLQRPCGCGGPGWRRVAYLNMSDTTQTSCPGGWELDTTSKRSCGRPANATGRTCYSVFFQSLSYSQVCGRIVGYQVGQPQAFFLKNIGLPQTINGPYVDGVSLTYGNPRQHIWTFAVPIQENFDRHFLCPCNDNSSVRVPSYVGNDYFCETGVPTGQTFQNSVFYPDPLWDGDGCGPTSACCTFNSYLSQLMMIWKYDFVELMQQLLKTLPLNWWKYTPSRQIQWTMILILSYI